MKPEAREIVAGALMEADNIIRSRLEAAGIAVPHIVMALVGLGDAVVVGNCRPDMIMDISKGLRKAAKQHGAASRVKRH